MASAAYNFLRAVAEKWEEQRYGPTNMATTHAYYGDQLLYHWTTPGSDAYHIHLGFNQSQNKIFAVSKIAGHHNPIVIDPTNKTLSDLNQNKWAMYLWENSGYPQYGLAPLASSWGPLPRTPQEYKQLQYKMTKPSSSSGFRFGGKRSRRTKRSRHTKRSQCVKQTRHARK